jgi:hypothetical protein
MKFTEKLKNLFTMTPEQLQHAENELRFLFGLKEKKLVVVPELQEWQVLPKRSETQTE